MYVEDLFIQHPLPAVYLFFSDLHLGRSDRPTERSIESAFIDCLKWHRGEVEGLYLVGDIFDQYIEYRHLVPKGGVRMLGMLAALADDGVPITYLLGNHDPWHQSYFESELDIRVEPDAVVDQLHGLRVYIAHGDHHDPSSSYYRLVRPLLRHAVPVFLYRYLLPGDTGFAIAKWVNRTFHGDELSSERIDGLRSKARHILCSQEDVDLPPLDMVVFAHSHHHEIQQWNGAVYLNPGAFRSTYTYGALDADGPRLLQWNGSAAHVIEPSK